MTEEKKGFYERRGGRGERREGETGASPFSFPCERERERESMTALRE